MARSIISSIALLALMALPAAAEIIQEIIDVPVEVGDIGGNIVRQNIKITIIRDDARTRSPFLILNHGRAVSKEKNAAVSVKPLMANARYFVSKGYAVFIPLRVGYGETGGPDVEFSGKCEARDYAPVYEAAAAQTVSVITYAKKLPYIDTSNGLVVGQSFGGTTAVAIAAKSIPGVRAVVNFAGGGGGRPQTHPDQPCSRDAMTALFASYGARARIPTLWLYSENDRYQGKDNPRLWHKAFVDRGGVGTFVQLPSYKTDGHPIFTGNPAAWMPAIEEFLQSCCGPTRRGGVTPTGLRLATDEGYAAYSKTLAIWAAKHNVNQAVIVVRNEGRVVHQAGIGGADPAAPVLLASLSKAITGACIASLVREGRLDFETTLGQGLARFFKERGRPKDPRVERVTIAQLLTHRAGFSNAVDGVEPTTRSVLTSYLVNHTTRAAPNAEFLVRQLALPLVNEPRAEFGYSNAGYFLLGAVIEEVTGQSYEAYCRDHVLIPAGAKGSLDPTWAVLGAAGGWRMTGADYLAFFEQVYPTYKALGATTVAWMLDPKDKSIGNSVPRSQYSLGLRMRDRGHGFEIWHTGSWRRQLAPDAHGPRSADTSTLAVRVADGTSWFVHSTPLVFGGARNELDRELLRTHLTARRQP